MPLGIRRPVLGIAILTAVAVVGAQSGWIGRGQPGTWTSVLGPGAAPLLTATDRAAFAQVTRQVLEICKTIAPLGSPVGVDIEPNAYDKLADADGLVDSSRPRRVMGAVGLQALFLTAKSRDGTRFVHQDNIAMTFAAAVNDVTALFGRDAAPEATDAEGGMWWPAPVQVGTVDGFPAYARGVVIARRQVPVFVPVSRARLVAHLSADADAALAKAEAGQDDLKKRLAAFGDTGKAMLQQFEAGQALAKQRADYFRAERAALTPADDTQPGYIVYDPNQAITPDVASAGAHGAQAAVAINPALFDAALPRSATQVIVVSFGGSQAFTTDLIDRVKAAFPWDAIAKLVAR